MCVSFRYKIGYDPEGWVQLDPATGKITTKNSLDRESKYVKNNMYNVTILAIDDGMTWSCLYILCILSMTFY